MLKNLVRFPPNDFAKLSPIIIFSLLGIVGNAQISVDFNADKFGGCAPLIVSFTNNTSGASAAATWYWDFGNGNSSTLKNPSSSYSNETTYNVTLTVKDGTATSSKTKTITVYKKPTPNFSVQSAKVCLPDAAIFTSNSTAGDGNLNSFYWDFGDGNTQQVYASQVSHNYSIPQTASVVLTVTNSFGCYYTVQKNNIVTIFPSITTSFTASKVFLCSPGDSTAFTTNSTGPGTLNYSWDFGDGNSSNQKSPVHVYNKSGAFIAKLTVNSSEGCTATVNSTTINVNNFVTDFTIPALICKGSYVSFNNTSTPTPTNSSWTFSKGSGYISYNNPTISTTFFQPGSNTLTLQNNFGTCIISNSKTFLVNDLPALKGFVTNLSGLCGAPETINLVDTTSTAVSWLWQSYDGYNGSNFASTKQQTTYAVQNNTFYNISLTVSNAAGCKTNIQQYVNISAPSIYIDVKNSSIPVSNSCGPNTVTFLSIVLGDSITSFKWDMGDGGTSTDPEPVYTFTKVGTNHILMYYTTKNGCRGTAHYDLNIFSKPKANFVSKTGLTTCANTSVIFQDLSTNSTSNNWDFGDKNPYPYSSTVQYQDTGTFTIRLIAVNGGCSDTMIKKDYIKVLPAYPVLSGYTNTCDGTRGTVTFSQKSKYADNIIWDFGDNTPLITLKGDSSTYKHIYSKTGLYTVTLSAVTAACNLSANTTAFVLLKQSPLLTLNQNSICSSDAVTATISNYEFNPAYSNIGTYLSYSFKFFYGDDTPFTNYIPPTNYNWINTFIGKMTGLQTGKQNLYAITTSSYFGCLDTTNIALLKINGAVVNPIIIKDSQCFKTPVIFNGSASSTSQITSWFWNFGDGNTITATTGGTISHQYASPNSYTASLTIADASSCKSTASVNVVVNGPKAAFTTSGTNVPLGTNVAFYNNTNNYNSYNTQYQWTFGDGGTSTVYNPTYTYTTQGTYTIKMVATNPTTGCTDSAFQTIIVRNFNSAFNFTSSFVTSSNCPPVIVRFYNTSVGTTSVLWSFGDGITSVGFSPSHIYAQPGTYKITLSTTGYNGLTSTYIDSVKINTDNTNIITNNLGGCLPQQVKLTAADQRIGTYYWDFGDGTIANASDSFYVHNYISVGSYQPRLLLRNKDGCTTAIDLANKVNISDGPSIVVGPKPASVCMGSLVQLSVVGGVKFVWSPANTLTDNTVANPFANPFTNTTYTVTAMDTLGCTSKDSVNVIVVKPFTMSVSADAIVCKGASTVLNASGAYTYKWINNTAELTNTNTANTIATPINSVTYTVVGKDSANCFSDTGNIAVQVIPLPTVTAGPDVQTQIGTTIQLNAASSVDVTKWRWDPVTYLNCSNCAAPQSTPFAPETYIVYVQNKYGCQASDTVNITLQCFETVYIPSAFTPNGDGVNDLFQIKGNGAFIKSFIIYGRSGNVVFERSNVYLFDPNAAWNGTYMGQPLEAGAYVYLVQLQCPSTGSNFTQKGTILLVR